MGSCFEGYKELRAIRVLPSVRHGEHPRAGVPPVEVLVCKLAAVDGLPASAVVAGEVTTLCHKPSNDAMEGAPLERQPSARRFRQPCLSGA